MCLSPITIKNPSKHFYRVHRNAIQVPCGHCLECLSKYQNSYMQRLCYEFTNWPCAIMVTLTYRNDTCPYTVNLDTGEQYYTVFPRHPQDAIKRFRTRMSRSRPDLKFKYFLTSEYGPRTLRPHYHAIFFGLTKSDFVSFSQEWEKMFGYTCVKDIPFDSNNRYKVARYVSKYCSKGFFENPRVKDKYVIKTFHLSSHGIGECYINLTKSYHLCKDVYRTVPKYCNGRYNPDWLRLCCSRKQVSIPGTEIRCSMSSYYSRKIYGQSTSLSCAMSDFLFEERLHDIDSKCRQLQSEHPDWSDADAYNYLDKQATRSLRYRGETLRKRFGSYYDKSKL